MGSSLPFELHVGSTLGIPTIGKNFLQYSAPVIVKLEVGTNVVVNTGVPNSRGDLKPDMFVDVVLSASLGKRLGVPESAVLYAGDRRVVFVDLGDGRFAPRPVTLGAKAGDAYEVLDGLKAGEIVVTSGNFLIAAESKLKSAAQKW